VSFGEDSAVGPLSRVRNHQGMCDEAVGLPGWLEGVRCQVSGGAHPLVGSGRESKNFSIRPGFFIRATPSLRNRGSRGARNRRPRTDPPPCTPGDSWQTKEEQIPLSGGPQIGGSSNCPAGWPRVQPSSSREREGRFPNSCRATSPEGRAGSWKVSDGSSTRFPPG